MDMWFHFEVLLKFDEIGRTAKTSTLLDLKPL